MIGGLALFVQHLLGRWAALIVTVLGLAAFAAIVRAAARDRRRMRALGGGPVEEITVEAAGLVESELGSNPIYVFQVDPDRLLVLFGQWMYQPDVYIDGERSIDADGVPDYGFPSDAFVLTREPVTGTVLALVPKGAPLTPQRTVPSSSLSFPKEGMDCWLVDGRIADLAPHS